MNSLGIFRQARRYITQIPPAPPVSIAEYPYKVKVATVIQRLPIVAKPLEDWEQEWRHLCMEKEVFEISTMPAPAVVMGKDMIRTKKYNFFFDHEDTTEHDLSGDKSQILRKFYDTLYLVTRPRDSKGVWKFHQNTVKGTELPRESAQKKLQHEFGECMRVAVAGHVPLHYTEKVYKAEKQKETGLVGERVFYLQGFHLEGSVDEENSSKREYAWVTLEELPEYLGNSFKKLEPFLRAIN